MIIHTIHLNKRALREKTCLQDANGLLYEVVVGMELTLLSTLSTSLFNLNSSLRSTGTSASLKE